MADNEKLSELTELTTPASDDLLYILDMSDSIRSKKIQYSNLVSTSVGGGGVYLIAASDTESLIKDRADFTCTGTADQVIIQSVLDSIPDGGEVFFAAGTYNISAPIVIDIHKGLHLQGSGFTTIFHAVDGLDDYVFTFDTTDDGIWARFSNFKIEGNAANQTDGGGIYAPGSLECIFDGIWFHQCYDWGVWLHSISEDPLNYGHNNRIINCVFDNGQDSPGIGGGIYMIHNDENHIHNNDFQFMGGSEDRTALGDGYCIKDAAGLNTITANAFVNSYNGVVIRDAGNTVVADNIFDRARVISCLLRGRQNTVRDNIFYQMGANSSTTNAAIGLQLEYYNAQTVEGNWFISDGTNGVTRSFIKDNSDATGGGDSQFTDNYFYVDGTLGTGILEITGASKRNFFADNHGNTIAGSGQESKTTTYTITPLDKMVGCDSTGGAFTVTLPAAAYSYQTVTIVLDVDMGDITIARQSGDTIGGVAANKTLADAGDSITLAADGNLNWRVIGSVGL